MVHLAIGIDIGGTSIKGALVNNKGEFIDQCSEPTPAEEGREAVLERVFSLIERLVPANREYCGIGIGSPGIIDQKTGDVIGASPNIKDWVGTAIRNIVSKRYNIHVAVDNDVNAITVGEFSFGNSGTVNDLACIAIGTGVGIGIILERRLFRRSHEMGHNVINFDNVGYTCGCGRYGCIEAIVSATGLVGCYEILLRKKENFTEEEITPKTIFNRFQSGDSDARRVVNDFVSALACAMVNILLSFSITNYIITGGISLSLPVFQDQLIAEVQKRSISYLNKEIKIKRGALDDRAGILGAASLIFNGCKSRA